MRKNGGKRRKKAGNGGKLLKVAELVEMRVWQIGLTQKFLTRPMCTVPGKRKWNRVRGECLFLCVSALVPWSRTLGPDLRALTRDLRCCDACPRLASD
jgi:hypothetical protein